MDEIHVENMPAMILLMLSAFILITWAMTSFPNLTLDSVNVATVSLTYLVFLIFTFLFFMFKAVSPELPLGFIDLGEPEKAWMNIGIGALMGVFVAISLSAGAIAKMSAMVFTVTTTMQFLFVILVAPVVEELFFRGTLLPTIAVYLSKPAALIFSSVTFTLYHIVTWGAFGLIGLAIPFLLALLLGLLTIKFESVAPAIIAHLTVNTLLILTTMPMGG